MPTTATSTCAAAGPESGSWQSVSRFLTTRLQLKVNETKSAVARPEERKFLGFTISNDPSRPGRSRAKALEKFKERVRDTDASDARGQSAAVDRAPGAIPDRLARLLRLLPDADRAAQPGRLDPSTTTHVSLATVEERADSLSANCGAWVCPTSTRASLPGRRLGSGAWLDIWQCSRRCPTPSSTRSAFLDSRHSPTA